MSLVGGALIGVATLLALGRNIALAKRSVSTNVTWDCGYAEPSSRMQYTASSFAQPLTDTFDLLLQTRRVLIAPHGLVSEGGQSGYRNSRSIPGIHFPAALPRSRPRFLLLRPLQQGKVQLYILYIAVTLLLLLLWQLA